MAEYIVIMHPQVNRELVCLDAKLRWKAEYRKKRLLAKGIVEKEVVGELVGFRGVTIHE